MLPQELSRVHLHDGSNVVMGSFACRAVCTTWRNRRCSADRCRSRRGSVCRTRVLGERPHGSVALREILTSAARNLHDTARLGRCLIVNQPGIATLRHGALTFACILGLACAATAGVAGLFAAAWNGITLIVLVASRKAAPRVGVMALGVAALYGLAALAAISGTDPEDIDSDASIGLAIVALGCTIVGITSAIVWAAQSRSRR